MKNNKALIDYAKAHFTLKIEHESITKGSLKCCLQWETSIAGSKFNCLCTQVSKELRRNPIADGAISGFSGQKSVPE